MLKSKALTRVNNSISLPELTYLASPWITGSGSNFSLWGETIGLELPKLHTVDGSIYFEGNITSFVSPDLPWIMSTDQISLHSLSLPSLDWVGKNLTVTAGNPLAVDIPELGYAKVIRLSGKIKRYYNSASIIRGLSVFRFC
jgi:hypothetical protein